MKRKKIELLNVFGRHVIFLNNRITKLCINKTTQIGLNNYKFLKKRNKTKTKHQRK